MPRPTRIYNPKILQAIGQWETRGQANPDVAVGDRGLAQPAYGRFQVRQPALADVQRLYPGEFAGQTVEALASSPKELERAADLYLQALDWNYGAVDLDHLIASFNAGPSAAKGPISNWDYVNGVKALYRQLGGQTMMPPMTNNPQRLAMGGPPSPMMGDMMGVAPPGRGVGMAPRPQGGQPQSLEDKLFAMDQHVQAAGMQPLSAQELRQIAQQMMGGGQQPPQPMLGQAPPPQGNPMMAGGLMRQSVS